jgi:hypothetical protein
MATPDNEKWLEAGTAIFGNSAPDLRPLVAMLRSGAPLPDGIRDMLTSLLDPDGEGYLYFRLELVNMENQRNNMSKDLEKLEVAWEYERRLGEGQRAEDAVYEMTEKKSIKERTVYNYVAAQRRIFNWLRGGK